VDPLGLYEEDIHFYMTYFLAVTSGIPPEQALVIAGGAQYVDENPFTRPLDPNNIVGSYLSDPSAAADRLATYHFTQAGNDPARIEQWYTPTDADRVAAINAGYPPLPAYISEPDDVYAARRIQNPSNPQLNRLLAAANNAPTVCSRSQLFGEYVHAFEDTFGHRGKDNSPINVNAGLGHVAYGHETDYTYNDTVYLSQYPSAIGSWNNREARTLEMERELFAQMQSQFGRQANGGDGFPIEFRDLQATLEEFNAITENSGDGNNFNGKRAVLNSFLERNNLGAMPTFNENAVVEMCKARQTNLQPITDKGDTQNRSQYPGVILNTPAQCG
jgi:hypothetical protein